MTTESREPYEFEGDLFAGDELDDKLDRDIDDDFESDRMRMIEEDQR